MSIIDEGLHEANIIKNVTEENLRHDLEDVLAFSGITNSWVKFLTASEKFLEQARRLGKHHFVSIACGRLCKVILPDGIGDYVVHSRVVELVRGLCATLEPCIATMQHVFQKRPLLHHNYDVILNKRSPLCSCRFVSFLFGMPSSAV